MNIFDYISKYKNKTFKEVPFNEIDNIIFSSIIYVDIREVYKNNDTIHNIGKRYFSIYNNDDYFKDKIRIMRDSIEILRDIKNTKRYKNIKVKNYIYILNKEVQYSSCVYESNNFKYISFMGTDTSFIGWKEDFYATYKGLLPSQKLAIDYLNKNISIFSKKAYIGGHSKGGFLSVISSLHLNSLKKNKIINIYNNDGPGLLDIDYNNKEYNKIKDKIIKIVPETSIVGTSFNSDNYNFIKTSKKGLYSHNPSTWKILKTSFVRGKRSKTYNSITERLVTVFNSYNPNEKDIIIDSLFEILENSKLNNFAELLKLDISKIISIINSSKNIEKEKKDLCLGALKKFIFATKKPE